MINNINLQNPNNIIAARKLNSGSNGNRVIAAPDYIPKYSITQKMNEADEFRKNVLYTNYQKTQKKKNTKKFFIVLAAALSGAFLFSQCKKV